MTQLKVRRELTVAPRERRLCVRGVVVTLCRLQHRQNITCRILEPGNRWPVSAGNSARIGLHVWFVVDFEFDSALAEFIHSFFHVVYGKIQNRKCGGLVVWFGIYQSLGLAEYQRALRSGGKLEPERLAIKIFGLLHI